MKEKNSLKERCKEVWNRHKKKIIITSGVVICIAGGYYLLQKKDGLADQAGHLFEKENVQEVAMEIANNLANTVNEPSVVSATREIHVPPHVMNLPKGKRASEAAKAFAVECNFVLSEGQTARHGSTRTIAA